MSEGRERARITSDNRFITYDEEGKEISNVNINDIPKPTLNIPRNILNESTKEYELHQINHGCTHNVFVKKTIGLIGMEEEIEPVVQLVNDDDDYYVQTFKNRKEVEEFVYKLRKASNEAWNYNTCKK